MLMMKINGDAYKQKCEKNVLRHDAIIKRHLVNYLKFFFIYFLLTVAKSKSVLKKYFCFSVEILRNFFYFVRNNFLRLQI